MSKDEEIPYRISAQQLIERSENRRIIPLTLSVDIALGGGIPLGATVVIGGRPKLGKTTMALQFGANGQNLYGCKVFFFPIEGRLTSLTLKQIRGLKLDIDNFEVIMPPPIMDKKAKIIGHKKWHSQRWWEVIGDTIKENPNSIIVIDSLANLSSEKEMSEGMGYQGRGDIQKLEAQFMRLYGDLIISSGTTVFLLTQIQANTSGYGAPLQMKLGNQAKHQADVILFGKSFEKWKEEAGRIRGHDMIYTVEASALGPPWMDMVVPLRYGYGIDDIKDVITHSINWNLIKKAGSWYYLPYKKGNSFDFIENFDSLEEGEIKKIEGIVKDQGESEIRNWLCQNPDKIQELQSLVKKRVFG